MHTLQAAGKIVDGRSIRLDYSQPRSGGGGGGGGGSRSGGGGGGGGGFSFIEETGQPETIQQASNTGGAGSTGAVTIVSL